MLLATITISSRTLRPTDGVLWDGDFLNTTTIHKPSSVARGDGAEAPPPSADSLGDYFGRLCDKVSDLYAASFVQSDADLGDDCRESLVLSDHLSDHLLY